MGNLKVSMFAKVSSLGARFFEKFVSTKAMNKKLGEMNNIGLTNVITATSVSLTTDFGSLAVGDMFICIDQTAGNKARAMPVLVAATAPFAPFAIGAICLVITPSS